MSCSFEDFLSDHLDPDCAAYQSILLAHKRLMSEAEEKVLQDTYLREQALKAERAALDAYRKELLGFHHFKTLVRLIQDADHICKPNPLFDEMLKCSKQSEPHS